MGYLKDYYTWHIRDTRKTYWIRELFKPSNWTYTRLYRKQRAERGWSDRDTWNGGEFVAEVLVGILRYLDREQNPIDWDEYFRTNYPDNYGYTSLTEVADDLQLYLDWDIIQYEEPLYSQLSTDDRWAMDVQVYSQAQNAMHFVAENIGHLWW